MTVFDQYLNSAHWQALEEMARTGAVCCKCGEPHTAAFPLQARHKTYERIGRENLSDLEMICQLCDGVWPQPKLTDKELSLCDPSGWAACAVVLSRDWNGCDEEVFDAWAEHRTLDAAMQAYRRCKDRKRKRRFADPESPEIGGKLF